MAWVTYYYLPFCKTFDKCKLKNSLVDRFLVDWLDSWNVGGDIVMGGG